MSVAVINFCTSDLDMLKFSTREARFHSGVPDLDYRVVLWVPTPEVEAFCAAEQIPTRIYSTNDDLGYLPNLRAMMNSGFDWAYETCDFACVINTDMAFGKNWLFNLIKAAGKNTIPNSLHLTPSAAGEHVIRANFGIPGKASWNGDAFWKKHDQLYKPLVETARDRGGWRNTATFPYILHRHWWTKYGPWELEARRGEDPPDRAFFARCAAGGASYVLCHNSIVYHSEGAERSGARAKGQEHLK